MGQYFQPTNDADVVRIMCLETDEPHPDTQSEKGSFGQVLHDHMSKAGADHHPPLGVETDQVFIVTEKPHGRMPKVEEFDKFDGLLITGSMYDAHGDNQWIQDLLKLLRGWCSRSECKDLLADQKSRALDSPSRLSLHRRLLRPPNPSTPPRR